ncbi:tetraacyldisaccharide 4'-kinase [Telluria beijingensis]|uniref:tetraacyldisaccharide 4'-kinase n=1 Tax=Telluria beijingensis TaxID=3068633 RepID=UPI00279594FE|nr:tetraacyldisaccharide 4'-kinase [Massilia sp. REN29]
MASHLESTLTRAWLRRGPLAILLLPVALLFRLLAGLRRLLFQSGLIRSERLPVPVIVVGNIFIGGTGKTPLTIWLADSLRAAGLRPGVISRGHGGAEGAPRAVSLDADPRQVGDEPLLIATRTGCPVVVGRRRVEAGRALLQAHPDVDVLIADDGLQHYALERDVEIVLFDGRGVGNGWLLPAGPLREPPSRRRDFTVVNAPELTPALARAVGGQPWRMHLAGEVAEPLQGGRRLPLAQLRDKRIVAAAGIGNPGRFFAMLRAAGLAVEELPLPDHHDFLDDPFGKVDADVILITEKDAVKCRQIDHLKNDPRLWVVPVTAQLDPALAEQIVEKCRGRSLA